MKWDSIYLILAVNVPRSTSISGARGAEGVTATGLVWARPVNLGWAGLTGVLLDPDLDLLADVWVFQKTGALGTASVSGVGARDFRARGGLGFGLDSATV